MALHGHGRGTDDLDVLVRPTAANAKQVFQALVRFGAPVAAHGVTEGLFAQCGYGYRMGVKPNLIEILTRVDGIEFDEAVAEGKQFELDGRAVRTHWRRSVCALLDSFKQAREVALKIQLILF
jgi:hypothetical protein